MLSNITFADGFLYLCILLQLRCEAKIHLEVSYFNEKTAIWEPLIEPVMMAEDDYRPWEVILKVSASLFTAYKSGLR